MAEPHVISALKAKRLEIAKAIHALQATLRERVVELDHIEASLRLFDPTTQPIDLVPRIGPKAVPEIPGDAGPLILDILRKAPAPLSTSELCEAMMTARGLDVTDKRLHMLMMKRTLGNLRHWQKKRGLVRALAGPRKQYLWTLAGKPNDSILGSEPVGKNHA